MPTPSCPGVNGRVGFTGQSPCAAWMSVWQRPEASMRTTISPGPATGLGSSSIRAGSEKSCTTAARIVSTAPSVMAGPSRSDGFIPAPFLLGAEPAAVERPPLARPVVALVRDPRRAVDELVPRAEGARQDRIVQQVVDDPLDLRRLEHEHHLAGGEVGGVTVQPEL